MVELTCASLLPLRIYSGYFSPRAAVHLRRRCHALQRGEPLHGLARKREWHLAARAVGPLLSRHFHHDEQRQFLDRTHRVAAAIMSADCGQELFPPLKFVWGETAHPSGCCDEHGLGGGGRVPCVPSLPKQVLLSSSSCGGPSLSSLVDRGL